jgi:group II intron reverse transcriptase/maturase
MGGQVGPRMAMDDLARPSPEQLFSPEALRRAWQFVRRNGQSPGLDGLRPANFEAQLESQLQALRDDVLSGRYKPQAVQRYYKPKTSGKNRPLSIWCLRDRVAQRVVHDYLTPLLERHFLPCSYGFRPGRSVEQAIAAVMDYRGANYRWVLDGDIENCFDSIPIPLLMSQARSFIPSNLALGLIELWLYAPVQHHQGVVAGVSQGSVLSPQLANLYLHRFDEMIAAALPESRLVRFADDFLILSRERREAFWSQSVAKRCLGNLRLRLNMQKTQVIHFEEGFQFLGRHFKGRRMTLLPPSSGNTT